MSRPRSVLFSDNRKHDYFDFLFARAITEPLHAVIFRDELERAQDFGSCSVRVR